MADELARVIPKSTHPILLIAAGRTEEAKLALDVEVAAVQLRRITPFSLADVVADEVERRIVLFSSAGSPVLSALHALQSVHADLAAGRFGW